MFCTANCKLMLLRTSTVDFDDKAYVILRGLPPLQNLPCVTAIHRLSHNLKVNKLSDSQRKALASCWCFRMYYMSSCIWWCAVDLRKDHSLFSFGNRCYDWEGIHSFTGLISTGTHHIYFHTLPHLLSLSLWLSLCFSETDLK